MSITESEALEAFAMFDPEIYCMSNEDIEKEKQRTSQQNRAAHLWFRQVAEKLNEAGYSVNDKQVLKLDMDFTEYVVKEYMFKKIASAMFGKDSTAKLTKEETSKAIEQLHRLLAENFSVYVPFPAQDGLS